MTHRKEIKERFVKEYTDKIQERENLLLGIKKRHAEELAHFEEELETLRLQQEAFERLK